ncbi:MAG: tyrosine-type recombinase/integrase [Pyrinomonadaceae bacterium]
MLAVIENAAKVWADSTTGTGSFHRAELLQSKRAAVVSFFRFSGKDPSEVKPADVQAWREQMEERHKPTTVYARVSRLASFYEWAMKDKMLGEFITSNPARLALPKCPKPYQTESAKAWSDEQLKSLLEAVTRKAASGDVVGLRDRALLLFYLTTGMRRNEVIALRGSDIELHGDGLIVWARVKGGDYTGREVGDPSVRAALTAYLIACDRMNVFDSKRPLWTRHDRAGSPGVQLTSHAFSKNLKQYAGEAGLKGVHVHQTRHTFARIVSEETGSITETQDALGHRNLATTRVYVNRIAVKRDKHSRQITARLNIHFEDEVKVNDS